MISRRLSVVAVLLALILSHSASTHAQLGTASVSGTVLDQGVKPVAGARVIVKNKATGQVREVKAGDDGTYKIQNLSPAAYEVKVEADGFVPALIDNIDLRVGEIPTVNIPLKPAGETTGENGMLAVTGGEAIGVDTTTSQVSYTISARTLANLPLNGRNFLDLAFLLPGNSPAPNFDLTKINSIEVSSAGQVGRGGNLVVDGGDNNDDAVGGTLQNFPLDAILEFQIITSLAAADIGRTGSSAINVVTKSGTNELHGSGGFFFRNARLSALPATLDRTVVKKLGKPPFDREQYTGSIGGPFKSDHAWYFAAFEYRKQDAITLTGQRDIDNQSVVANFSPAPLRNLLLLTRVDWQVTPNDRMAFRYGLQDDNQVERTFSFISKPIDTASHLQKSFNRYNSFLYNFVHTFSPQLLNDLTFQGSRFTNRIPTFFNGPELVFPSVADGGDIFIPEKTIQNRFQLRDSVTLVAGPHSLKFGGEYQRFNPHFDIDLLGVGAVVLAEDFAQSDRNGDKVINDLDIPILFTVKASTTTPDKEIRLNSNNYIAFYAQDDWAVRPNFTLNIGLRYELVTDSTDIGFTPNPIVSPFLAPGGRRRDRDNFGPRIGFNWDPFGNGRTSIHGGYGIYYDRIIAETRDVEQRLDGRRTRLQVRAGSELDASGKFVPGTPTLANPFAGPLISSDALGIFVIDNHLEHPTVQQFDFGIRREIVRNLTLSVDAVHTFGTKFLISRPIGTVFDPVAGAETSVVNLESSGKNWYDGLLVNVEKRSERFSFIASYTLSKALSFSNDDQVPFITPLDPNNLRLEKGPTPNDQRHRFTFAGVINAPFGIQISPIYRLESDVPFDILLPDGSTRIPLIQRNAGARQFRTGAQLNAFIRQINAGGGIPGVGLLPLVRDDLELGDSFTSFDLRLTKTFKLSERLSIRGIAEVFNLFNVTNIRGVNNGSFSGFQNALVRDSQDPNDPGFLRSSTFGAKLNTAGGVFGTGGPRAFQFAVRVNF